MSQLCAICKNRSKGNGRGRKKVVKSEPVVFVEEWEPSEKIEVDLRSGKLHKGEYCSFWNLLITLGYDINGDVHEQFCAKYNLPTKPKPKLPFKVEWCKEDCFNTEQ